jgi:hypothetical protein
MRKLIEIEGKRYAWRDILNLSKAQRDENRDRQLTLYPSLAVLPSPTLGRRGSLGQSPTPTQNTGRTYYSATAGTNSARSH